MEGAALTLGIPAESPWKRPFRGRYPLEVGSQLLEELTLALGSHDAGRRLATLEENKGGDAHHIEAAGDVEVVVDVQLGDVQLARLLGGDLFEHRSDHFARATPFGPEVHQDRNV